MSVDIRSFKKKFHTSGPGKVGQWLRTFAALTESLGVFLIHLCIMHFLSCINIAIDTFLSNIVLLPPTRISTPSKKYILHKNKIQYWTWWLLPITVAVGGPIRLQGWVPGSLGFRVVQSGTVSQNRKKNSSVISWDMSFLCCLSWTGSYKKLHSPASFTGRIQAWAANIVQKKVAFTLCLLCL